MKKLSLVLAVLMILGCLAACADKEEAPEQTSVAASGTTAAASIEESTVPEDTGRYDSEGFLLDDLPELNFNKKIRILGWKEVTFKEFNTSEATSNTVDEAIYNRNRAVEDRLNVVLEYTVVAGNNSNFKKEYWDNAQAMNNVGEVDLFAAYAMAPSRLTINGMTTNLNNLEYLDLSKPWWSNDMNNLISVYGKTYMATGDISPTMLANTYALFFNQNLVDSLLSARLKEMNADSIYSFVYNNTWTFDTFFSLCKDVGSDVLNDGKSADDTFAYVGDNVAIDPWFYAAGLKTLDKDADGGLVISDLWASEKTGTVVDKLVTFFRSTDAGVKNSREGASENDKTGYNAAFKNGTSVFLCQTMKTASSYTEMNFGIVPLPKYNSDQTNYRTMAGFTYSMYSIASGSGNVAESAAVMEALASDSYRRVTPVMFENYFKLRMSQNLDVYKMWDIIRNACVCDAGRAFTNQLHDYGWSYFRNTVMDSMNTGAIQYASDFKALEEKLNADIVALNDFYRGADK